MKNFSKSKHFNYILLATIMFFALVNIILTFTLIKKNYMTDEAWSYGLANSYYAPYIFSTGDVTHNASPDNYQNINTWITSNVFKDYITVNDGEAFSYDSIWYNQTQDLHPPFYYAILHTICSFFPGIFSIWFGFSINIVSFLLVTLLLYKLCCNMTHSSVFSLLMVAFYAFNSIAVDTFVFIRMYSLATVFYVALLYYTHKLLVASELSFIQHFLPLTLITCLGTLTHYHFAVYAFLISACVCFYLLFKKTWKTLITFSCSMLLGIALVFPIFPGIMKHLTLSTTHSSVDMNLFIYNLNYIVALVGGYQIGIPLPAYKTMFGTYLLLTIAVIIFLFIPIWFVFRNELWMKNFLAKFKNGTLHFFRNIKNLFSFISPTLYIAVFVIIGMLVFFSKTLVVPDYSNYVIRFLFPMMAIYYFASCAILYYIAKAYHLSAKHCKITFICVIVFCSLTSNLIHKTVYAFPDSPHSGKTMDKLEENSTCIIATSAGWLLTAFPFHLLDAGNIYVVNTEYLFEVENTLSNLPASAEGTPIYLLLDTTSLLPEEDIVIDGPAPVERMEYTDYNPKHTKEDYIEYFSSLPYVEKFEQVGLDAAYYSDIEIYQLR